MHYEKFQDGTVKCIEDEIPFEVPEGWAWCRLDNVGNWGAGATPSRSNPAYYNGNIPWLKTGDLNDGIITTIPETITELALKETSVRLNPIGSILIAMYGATIGKLGILGIEATTNQACCACIPNASVITQYLFEFLLSQRQQFIDKGVGGAQPNISKEKIVATIIAIPPIEEQQRIVECIERYDASINFLEKDIRSIGYDIRTVKSKILDLAIRGKLVQQDPTDEPASVLLERIRAEKEELIKQGKIKRDKNDSVIFKGDDNSYYEQFCDGTIKCIEDEIKFDVPEGWAWTRLKTLGEYRKGPFGSSITKSMFVPDGPESIKVYEQKNAINKDASLGTYFITSEKFQTLKSFEVFPNDIIVSCAGTIGETYVLPTNIRKGIINQALMKITLFDLNILEFYLIYFDSVLKESANSQGHGVALKNIPPFDVLKKYLMPIPPIREQARIIKSIENSFRQLDQISESLS